MKGVDRSMAATWWPGRRRLAALAVLTALATGALAAALGGGSGYVTVAWAYTILAGAAVVVPAAITAQVVAGQIILAGLLLGPAGATPLSLVPILAGVIVTAELLAVVARLDTPLERDARDALSGAGFAATVGGSVFAGVGLVAAAAPSLPTLVSVGVAALACLALAGLLLRGRIKGSPEPPSPPSPTATDSGTAPR